MRRRGAKFKKKARRSKISLSSNLRRSLIGEDERAEVESTDESNNEYENDDENEGDDDDEFEEDTNFDDKEKNVEFVTNSTRVGKGASPDGIIPESMLRSLRYWNIAVAASTGILWLTTLILLLIYALKMNHELIANLSSDFTVFGGLKPLALGRFDVNHVVYAIGPSILIPSIIFSFSTALFHVIILIGSGGSSPTSIFRWYSKYAINNSYNPIRWIQYSITYAMITWIVAQISGVSNFMLLIALLSMKLAIYGSLWIFETTNQRRKTVAWESFGLSTFLFIFMWIILFFYFISQASSAGSPLFTNVPWFFWFIFCGAVLSSLLGGLNVIVHYAGKKRARNRFAQKSNLNYEQWWMIHSMITNLYFCIILIIATIMTCP